MNKKFFWRILFIFIPIFVALIALFSWIFTTKFSNGYRPSIFNYESYLSPKIIKKIKQNYNYKEFKEINEFSQALNAERAIAGVGSDFQAAQLIIDNKIKKLDFTQIYGNGANDWNKRKLLYRQEIVEHMLKFDKLIYNKIKNKQVKNPKAKILNATEYDVDGDNKPDHFYEYIVPYYSQDKGIAYTLNKDFRQHLDTKNLESKLKNKNLDWDEIINILKEHNYKRFGWTNAYYDNLMLGSIYAKNKNYNYFDETNYKKAIDDFVNFVEKTSKHSIKNTEYNYFTNDGLELVNHLIEPKEKRSDASILYNGDALDAYYSKDNFANSKEGMIRFIRPKNNYLLMDGWVVSKTLNNEQTNKFLNVLRENIYSLNNVNSSYDNLLKKLTLNFFNELRKNITNQDIKNEINRLKNENNLTKEEAFQQVNKFINLLESNDIQNENEILNFRNAGLFESIFSKTFSNSNIGEILNFDYISYTPTDNITFKFIEKWYFMNDQKALNIYRQPKENNDYKLLTYPIIDSNLRTKIASYYYEKTKS